jgi:hypothetical protein
MQTIVAWSRRERRWLAPALTGAAVVGFLGIGFASVPMLPVRADSPVDLRPRRGGVGGNVAAARPR